MKEKTQQKLPKLTKKQKGFVDDYVLSENGTQAALKNYDIQSEKPEKVASVIATENLAKPSIIEAIEVKRETLKSALEKQGVTPEKIARKIDSLLEHEDPNAVDKGLKHATNIYGITDEPEKRPGNTYNFIFSEAVQKEVKEIEARIKEKLIQSHVQEN